MEAIENHKAQACGRWVWVPDWRWPWVPDWRWPWVWPPESTEWWCVKRLPGEEAVYEPPQFKFETATCHTM